MGNHRKVVSVRDDSEPLGRVLSWGDYPGEGRKAGKAWLRNCNHASDLIEEWPVRCGTEEGVRVLRLLAESFAVDYLHPHDDDGRCRSWPCRFRLRVRLGYCSTRAAKHWAANALPATLWEFIFETIGDPKTPKQVDAWINECHAKKAAQRRAQLEAEEDDDRTAVMVAASGGFHEQVTGILAADRNRDRHAAAIPARRSAGTPSTDDRPTTQFPAVSSALNQWQRAVQ